MTRSSEMKTAHRYRSQTVAAAAWVLIRRPAFWLIVIAFLIQVFFLISALNSEYRVSQSEDNIPSYEPNGKKLWSVRDDLAIAFENDQPNSSIQRLHLDYVKVNKTAGKTTILIGDPTSQSANDSVVPREVPVDRFVRFLDHFHGVQWVSLRTDQLQALPADVFNRMPELRGIEFSADELTPQDLSRLSSLTKIEHLTLAVGWCDYGLQQLATLPNLKSLHLIYRPVKRGRFRKIQATRPFISVENIVSLKALPKLEEIAIQEDGELFNYAFATGLTSDCKDQYEKVVAALQLSPGLKSVYAGQLRNPHGNDLMVKMAEDLPNLAIFPATFDSSMAESATLGNLATIIGLIVLTMHLVTCNSLPQNCLLNGAQTAHLKVYLALVSLLLVLPTATTLLQTYAHWLPVITFEVSLLAVVTSFGVLRSTTVRQSESTASRWKKLTPLLIFPVVGLLVFVWLGNSPYGAWVAKYFCGHYPGTCVLLLAAASIVLASHLRSFLFLHRFWAESGISPVATWAEIQESLTTRKSAMRQQGDIQLEAKNRLSRMSDQWLLRLSSITGSFRQKPRSFVVHCRLWLAAITQTSLPRSVFGIAIVWPLCCLWPFLYEIFTVGPSTLMESSGPGMMIGMMTMGGCFIIFQQWHARRAMFEIEILRPISRNVWRNTVMQSMLFAVGVMSLVAWGQIHLIRLIAGQPFTFSWGVLSLLSVLSATLLATGLNLLALIQRGVVNAAVFLLTALASFTPLIFTAMPASDGTSNFSFWLAIVVSEAILGGLILVAARSKWGHLELANQ